jgi:nucleoside-diphosphate-sugar epimerase
VESRRAYVTGATGFVGRALVPLLLRKGIEVTCLVRPGARAGAHELEGVRYVVGDITNRDQVAATIRGHALVFHLASRLEIGLPLRLRPTMRLVNVTGAVNVLEEAWSNGAERIIHCNSVGALGSSGPPGRIEDENHRHNGHFPCYYLRTKYEALQAANRFIADGAPIVNVLPQAAYGPGSVKLVGRQMWLTLTGKMTTIPDVPGIFGYIHIDDMVNGLWLAAENGRVGASYILAGPLLNLSEFYRIVATHAGVAPPRKRISAGTLRLLACVNDMLPGGESLTRGLRLTRESVAMITQANWCYSAEKARVELGWQARTLEEGVPETLEWIRSHSQLFC